MDQVLERPAHVPPERVFDFDFYHPPGAEPGAMELVRRGVDGIGGRAVEADRGDATLDQCLRRRRQCLVRWPTFVR